MIRFVGNNPNGLPHKRSQTSRACEQCRQRKKRCIHNPADPSTPLTGDCTTEPLIVTPQPVQHQQLDSNEHVDTSPPLQRLRDSAESEEDTHDRFVGDLNPESIFLAATSPQTTLGSGDDNVGVWIPRKALEGLPKQLTNRLSDPALSPNPLLSNILLPYIQRQCQQLLPPPEAYNALYQIYCQEVHSVFPIIDLETLRTTKNLSNALILKQTISLAASTSPRAKNHLYLPNSVNTTATNEHSFRSQLVFAIRESIDLSLVRDRIIIVQVFTVLALFSHFLHQGDLAAELTARAISRAQTAGLHVEVPVDRPNETYLSRLFCCVWAIDKLNAAFQGRPTMMHAHDFGKDLKKATASQDGCFRLVLNIASLLDTTIALYRPGNNNSNPEIPSFEDLIHECDASRVSAGLLATVELLYHAVTMLSCRTKSSSPGNCPPTLREALSAANTVSIIGTEYQEQLSYLAFVPYALSLSLRVLYRELRFSSKSPFTRNRARKQLLNACSLLRRSFADAFPLIIKVADLAEQTVQEMDKVHNNMVNQQQTTRSVPQHINHDNRNASAGTSIPADLNSQISLVADITAQQTYAVEGLPELDIFEFFDPDFDLDAIDAALVDNMALAVSPTVNGGGSLEALW